MGLTKEDGYDRCVDPLSVASGRSDAKATVERQPRPETYRALLEAQSDLQRHDVEYGRPTLRSEPRTPKVTASGRGRQRR